MLIRTVCDRRPEEEDIICSRAQELLTEGLIRGRYKIRIDQGVKRPHHASGPGTESAWLHKRRKSVAEAVLAQPALELADAGGEEGWTAKHAQCERKQLRKRAARKVEAFRDGLLLQSEITDDLRAQVADTKEKEQRADRKTTQKKKRTDEQVAMMDRPLDWGRLASKQVWLCEEMRASSAPAATAALRGHGLSLTDDWAEAEVFVVARIEEIPKPAEWRVRLCGGWVLSGCLVIGSPARGTYIKYEAATRLRRTLYMSERWMEKHSLLTNLFQKIATPLRGRRRAGLHGVRSQWRLASSLQELQESTHGMRIALMVGGETMNGAGIKAMSKDDFLRMHTVVDHSQTGTGSLI